MAYKFYNIGKANAEIERLENELKSEKEKVSALESNEPEALAAAQGELANLKTKLAQTESDLATAKQSIQTVSTERDKLAAKATKLEADLAASTANVDAEASRKALEITATQGQPPVETKPTAEPAKPETKTELKGLDKVRAAIREQIKGTK